MWSLRRGIIRRPSRELTASISDREEIFKGRKDKFVCLMDLALMAMRKLKAEGKLQDQEESDEINACSIVVPVEIDGKEEEWLVNFKNETTTIPPRLSLSEELLPVWEEQSGIRFPAVLMFIRPCG